MLNLQIWAFCQFYSWSVAQLEAEMEVFVYQVLYCENEQVSSQKIYLKIDLDWDINCNL